MSPKQARPLDHPVVSERYFFPRIAPLDEPVFIEVEGARLACAALPGGPNEPTLLHFHGNGEVVADWLPDLGPALRQCGYAPFFAEYRGYGGSTGRPLIDTMLDDALCIVDQVGVPYERIVVYGRSVGSLYALHVAANRPVAGLVLESGIADVGQRLALRMAPAELGLSQQQFAHALSQRFDHQAKLQAVRCPVRILHTTHDHMVDIEHARSLAGWAGSKAKLVEYAQGDHNSIFAYNGAEILRELVGLREELGL